MKSLSDFVAGLQEELLLCPVRALCICLDRSASFSPLPRRVFLSPRRPSRALSKNALSFFLREVIHEAEAGRPEVGPVRAHSIRGVSTSAAFHCNWSVASVLESATWRSNSVFVSFYLHDLQHEIDGIRSLGMYPTGEFVFCLSSFCGIFPFVTYSFSYAHPSVLVNMGNHAH